MVVAALYDSSLLKTLQLSGDMAMYVSVGEHPYFLLSVGGYHPDFQPPAACPRRSPSWTACGSRSSSPRTSGSRSRPTSRSPPTRCSSAPRRRSRRAQVPRRHLHGARHGRLRRAARVLAVLVHGRLPCRRRVTAGGRQGAAGGRSRRAAGGPRAVVRDRPRQLRVLRDRTLVDIEFGGTARVEAPPDRRPARGGGGRATRPLRLARLAPRARTPEPCCSQERRRPPTARSGSAPTPSSRPCRRSRRSSASSTATASTRSTATACSRSLRPALGGEQARRRAGARLVRARPVRRLHDAPRSSPRPPTRR